MHDYFASGTGSVIVSWIVAIPAFCMIGAQIALLFRRQENIGRLLTIWIGICFLVLSPLRYLFFLLVLFTVYPFQNIRAVFSIFGLGLFGAIAFALLYLLVVFLPLKFIYWLAGTETPAKKPDPLAACFLAPALAFLGSCAFSLFLPYAAVTTRNLDTDALVKATNGPATCAYYFIPGWLNTLPKFVNLTEARLKDTIRAHVVSQYLGKSAQTYYLKQAYPHMMDDTALATTLGVQFKYQPDGTPTLAPSQRYALAELNQQGGMGDEQRKAYDILTARGVVSPADGEFASEQSEFGSATDTPNPPPVHVSCH